jgi:Holliday junction resolvase RusA-like endonuclease
MRRKDGRAGVAIVDDNPKAKNWQSVVRNAAWDAMLEQHPGTEVGGRREHVFDGPIGLSVTFTLRRPRGHFGVRGVLPSAPAYPIVRPDCTKLLRGVEDALTGVVWRDDAQVIEQAVTKTYGTPEGVQVVVWTL